MENTMMKSQSAAAVNSAVSKIFSKKSVLDLAVLATEYMACGSWKSVVVYAIKDAIESMVSKILDNYIKDGDKWSIAEWEKLTGMVYMAPELEEDNDITEEGYSMRGLEYLAETMPVVPVDAIIEGVNEYFSDCYAVAHNRCMGFYECGFEEFCDIVWSYVWPNVMTDEALEAETRYYMEFNDRLRYMLDNGELGALYIYNNDFVRSRFDEEAEVAA